MNSAAIIEKALRKMPASEWANIAYMTTGIKEGPEDWEDDLDDSMEDSFGD